MKQIPLVVRIGKMEFNSILTITSDSAYPYIYHFMVPDANIEFELIKPSESDGLMFLGEQGRTDNEIELLFQLGGMHPFPYLDQQ